MEFTVGGVSQLKRRRIIRRGSLRKVRRRIRGGIRIIRGKIAFGQSELELIFAPGHSPGHLCFYSPADNFLIGGDVLFYQSIGRTDLPGGNHQQLLDTIKHKLFNLPTDCVVYPGHGPNTQIGFEKAHNPFLL